VPKNPHNAKSKFRLGFRPGLHARMRSVPGLTPRSVLREPLRLPVVMGDSFTTEEESLWEEFDTVGAGRFASPAAGKDARALTTVTTESMTMTWDPGFLTNPDTGALMMIRNLRKILRKRAVFDLLVVQKPNVTELPDFSGLATIRRLAITTKSGEPESRYFQIDISSHREIDAQRRRHTAGSGARSNLPTTAKLSATDTLRSLAEHYYGSGSAWRQIAGANGLSQWGSEDPLVKMGRYKVGDRIKIPQPPSIGSASGIGNAEVAPFFE
jgi:hypothetical protein